MPRNEVDDLSGVGNPDFLLRLQAYGRREGGERKGVKKKPSDVVHRSIGRREMKGSPCRLRPDN